MTKLRIRSGASAGQRVPPGPTLDLVVKGDNFLIEGSQPRLRWSGENGHQFFLFGNVIGVRSNDGTIRPASTLKIEPDVLENPTRFPEVEGRFVVVKLSELGQCEIWTDGRGRIDVYWQAVEGGVVVGTSLDVLPVASTGSVADCVGVAHSLTVYGSRPAKQHTLYQNTSRLGVDKGLRISGDSIEILTRPFKPEVTREYTERDLHRYADILLEAIRARASNDGNVVYLSSGWDSTSILACLVHLFGAGKTRAVIGRMRYANRSGVINQFELDRAQAVAGYFGVNLDLVELDYRSGAEMLLDRTRDLFQSQQFNNLTGFNHWLLAEGAAKKANGDEVIFAGEMSDGAHNLGFSQFVSIFHPASLEFREYSDKMASYLFGPTFLNQLINEKHEHDPIWQIFKQLNSSTKFEKLERGEKAVSHQILSNFFLRGGRLPLYSLENTRLLTPQGREKYLEESERVYLAEARGRVTADNLYAWYLHLYDSFHWQGATVSTLEHTAEAHGLRCVMPFHDSGIIQFLSAMPESWGRGLDLNPTKYPLKWVLRNRIDYPIHLQVGPHSYIYDVDPSFTHLGEILNGSSFKDVFIDGLGRGEFIHWIASEMFDRSYIDDIVGRYLKGEELRGAAMSDLGVLAMHSAISVYGL